MLFTSEATIVIENIIELENGRAARSGTPWKIASIGLYKLIEGKFLEFLD